MSGGSYDYLYLKIQDVAEELSKKNQPAYRKAFTKHLELIADAMHAIELVDSGDMDEGDDEDTIMKCIDKKDILDICIQEAKYIKKQLEDLINEIN